MAFFISLITNIEYSISNLQETGSFDLEQMNQK